MNPVSPVIDGLEDEEVRIAEHQDEYGTLVVLPIPEGYYISRWEVTDKDLENILKTRSIYLYQYHCNKPLTPVNIQTEHPIPSEQALIEEPVNNNGRQD
jgi:hypothetical protein